MINNKIATPIHLFNDKYIICYKGGKLLFVENHNISRTITVIKSKKEKIIGRSNLLFRLLRLGIRSACLLDDTNILLSIKNTIYELNFCTEKLSKGFYCGKGIRPLSFTKVEALTTIESGIYFGGYLANREKEPVNVYKRVEIDKWEIVYTFPKGLINHIHTIVNDPYRDCLWIFTGDFDEASAIWKVTDNFNKVERVCYNDQKYRACVVFALPDGLLYATDTPFKDNYIYLMNTNDYSLKKITPMDGSCIYGCQWKDRYVFSSSVEGDGRNTSIFEFLFSRKRGAGIKDNYVHMYCGNIKDGFKEIYKEEKDNMPYYTFQFGVFKFPYGINNTDTLYFQPVATKKNDLRLLSIKDS